MTRTELLKHINYALNHIQYGEEREKEIKAAFKKLKQDLKRIKPLEKEVKDLIAATEEFINENNQHMVNQGLKIKKYKKAIKIIKDKKVSIELLLKTDNFNQYNRTRHLYNADFLTQEEYKLLKEVLDNVRG